MRLTNEELQLAIDNALAARIELKRVYCEDYKLDNHIDSLCAEQRLRASMNEEESSND